MKGPVQRSLPRAPRSERGTVLIIALIVLVAMTLAGIATMRSVDTATLMAGNIAFRQSAVNAADQGLQAGFAWMSANMTSGNLNSDNLGAGYSANAATEEPKWSDPGVWAGAAQLNGGAPDAGGNRVWFKVERMCPLKDCPANTVCAGVANTCGSTPDPGLLSREGQDHFRQTSNIFTKPPAIHYRVTAKAEGPRGSVSIVQTMLRGI
jgi:type IV pilus assembly protein PilX